MTLSERLIKRPVAMTLAMFGVLLFGAVAYWFLPIAALPAVDLPTIRVTAALPGASAETMASLVAAPLEKRLGKIDDISQMVSANTQGSTAITIQFGLDRDIGGAAQDVAAAISAAGGDLPKELSAPPAYAKANPVASPVIILALTSETIPVTDIFALANTILAPKLSQIEGVSDVLINGTSRSAIRIQVDPSALAARGLGLNAVQAALAAANAAGPKGVIETEGQSFILRGNDQLLEPESYASLVVAVRHGIPIRLGDVAEIGAGPTTTRAGAWHNGRPAVILNVFRQSNANIVATVERIKEALPNIRHWLPATVRITLLADRADSIRASVANVEMVLVVGIVLVVATVFLFLRRFWATVVPCLAIPVSLAGAMIVVWLMGFSINNLSLMGIAVAVGFIVDDAIIMVENVARHMEEGASPMEAASRAARQLSFTILSISLSLVAAFLPILLLGGVIGRIFREFSVTLTAVVVISAIVSITVTPTMSARLLRPGSGAGTSRWGRRSEAALERMNSLYAASLAAALSRPRLMLAATLAITACAVYLYIAIPKSFLPSQDTGVVTGLIEGPPDISFAAMSERLNAATALIREDPAVEGIVSFIGTGPSAGRINNASLYIQLKPEPERKDRTETVVERLRARLSGQTGATVLLRSMQDLSIGARAGKGAYQFTLQSMDAEDLGRSISALLQKLRQLPEIRDVASDQEPGALQIALAVDRDVAARLGVSLPEVEQSLFSAFGQRQVSTLYSGGGGEAKVVMEVAEPFRTDPLTLRLLHVGAAAGRQVPLDAFVEMRPGTAQMVVSHQGQFPAATISFNLSSGVALGTGMAAVKRAVEQMGLPPGVKAGFEGDSKAFQAMLVDQLILLGAALVFVYIVLGVLYESFVHPLTILSALPPAGLGALLLLRATDTDLSLIAIIGIILLIGIVKKNAILLVDFALEAQRRRGLDARQAIVEACLMRFRPIVMTTLTALVSALPLAFGSGAGSELHKPFGLVVAGGLALSLVLTLYVTPAVYLSFDRLKRRGKGACRTTSLTRT